MNEQFDRYCWCGSTDELTPFNEHYARCAACDSLILQTALAQPKPQVRNDADDFYGWQYFNSFQQTRNSFPSLAERARLDLPERCAYWLNALVDFKLPPAKVLELGAAHGGFVAMMRQAGYDATGLDLSPAVIDAARHTFGVPMLLGPLEDQSIEPNTLDVIVLMDVIEHLSDPLATLGKCMSLLKDDGLIIVQTPRYRSDTSMLQLVAEQDRFLQQLRPGEHVHLFSEAAARQLFRRLGAAHFEALEPIFWFYDQFFIVSRQPIARLSDEQKSTWFEGSVERRFVRAMLDGEDRFRNLLEKHRRALKENERLQGELLRSRMSIELRRTA